MADRTSASHAMHDQELVAGCRDCDALAPDVASLITALTSLRGGTDTGHRDFRISADQAGRLRRGRGLRAWLRPLAGTSFGFARPLGSALTVVALVGLVASSFNGLGGGAGGLAEMNAQSTDGRDLGSQAPVSSPETDPDAFIATPKAGASGAEYATRTLTLATDSAIEPTGTLLAQPEPQAPASGSPTPNGFFLASLVLLPIGLLLVLGRGIARRLIGAAREP